MLVVRKRKRLSGMPGFQPCPSGSGAFIRTSPSADSKHKAQIKSLEARIASLESLVSKLTPKTSKKEKVNE